jgi:hypothetical protein
LDPFLGFIAYRIISISGMVRPIANAAAHVVVTVWWYGNVEVRSDVPGFAHRTLIGAFSSLSFENLNEVPYDCFA